MLAACDAREPDPQQDAEASEFVSDVGTVGNRLGLRLPPGTQVLGFKTEAGLDDAVLAKLRIPTSRSQQFIRDCGVTRFRPGEADQLGADQGFWDPHQAKALRIGRPPLPAARGLVLGLDESRADGLIVYAMSRGT